MTDRQPRVLVVEDQPEIQQLVASMLFVRGLSSSQAGSVARARELIERERPEIIFLDVTLPDGSGLSLVDRAGSDGPLVVVITGSSDLDVAVQALRKGVIDFIAKPFAVGDLFGRIDQVVAEWRARERLRECGRTLAAEAGRADDDLARAEQRVEDAHNAAVAALAAALELKDHETDDHRRRVSANSVRLGRALGLGAEELRALRWGAYLHDVGKIGVPERILSFEGPLAAEDQRVLEQHPALGARILAVVPFLAQAADVVRGHHERWDGRGYPQRLAGSDIPRSARIAALADALDEATSDRPEHRARPFSAFAAELAREADGRFDPRIVETFLAQEPSSWLVQPAANAADGNRKEAAAWNA
jgi:putative two-component system response regulator